MIAFGLFPSDRLERFGGGWVSARSSSQIRGLQCGPEELVGAFGPRIAQGEQVAEAFLENIRVAVSDDFFEAGPSPGDLLLADPIDLDQPLHRFFDRVGAFLLFANDATIECPRRGVFLEEQVGAGPAQGIDTGRTRLSR